MLRQEDLFAPSLTLRNEFSAIKNQFKERSAKKPKQKNPQDSYLESGDFLCSVITYSF